MFLTSVSKSPDGAAMGQVSSRSSRSSSGRQPAVAVLVLHGGSADSVDASRWRDLAIVRLWPVAKAIGRQPDVAVHQVKFSVRGWNGSGDAAVRDARWALGVLRETYPGNPLVVVGHSMGGRVAVHVGKDPDVAGLVLLAPWVPSGDPADHLTGVPVVLVQGGRDRVIPLATTEPWISHAEHAGARLQRTVLPWAEHTMLLRYGVWHRAAAAGVQTVRRGWQAPAVEPADTGPEARSRD